MRREQATKLAGGEIQVSEMKSMAIGVFDEAAAVKAAIEQLNALLFRSVIVFSKNPSPEFPAVEGDIAAIMTAWGVPPEEIAFALAEVDAGRILLAVKAAVGLAAAEQAIRAAGGRSVVTKNWRSDGWHPSFSFARREIVAPAFFLRPTSFVLEIFTWTVSTMKSTHRIRALASDGDGTLTKGKNLAIATAKALEKFVATGRRLILVTGENVPQLQKLPHHKTFDLIVAENGGLLYWPATGKSKRLAEPPPGELIRRVRALGIDPLEIGEIAICTDSRHASKLDGVIQACGLRWRLLFNRDQVMALPDGVDKSSGLCAALKELKLKRHEVVGVGDAENDIALLPCCGLGVAVHTAVVPLKECADLVTKGGAGRGVVELIDRILAGTLPHRKHRFTDGKIRRRQRV